MSENAAQLHVLHLSTQLGWRGGEQQIAYLMEEFRSLGLKQNILCPAGSRMEQFCLDGQFDCQPFARAGSISPRLSAKMARFAGKMGCQIIHAHDSHSLNHALLAYSLFRLPLPIVVNRRVDFPIRWRFKYTHRAVKRIICDSEAIRKVMARCIGGDDKLLTIHSGIDVRRFCGRKNLGLLHRQYGLDPQDLLVGNVAALADHKDYRTFVDTAERVLRHHEAVRFFIIGDGPQREEIEQYITARGLREKVILTGFRTDIADLLPELDCFLITSKTEGLGTSILEAFAAKVPVVATRAGGIPEIVRHDETGLLAEVGDSRALSDSVVRILDDASLRRRLTTAASQVPLDFDKVQIARRTVAVYRTLKL